MITKIKELLQENFVMTIYGFAFLSKFIERLLEERTTNLKIIAEKYSETTKPESAYRIIKRHFQNTRIDVKQIIEYVLKRFPQKKYQLIMDRTDWKFGKEPINILMLSIVVKRHSIPLYWTLLDKSGSSNYEERTDLLLEVFKYLSPNKISDFLCDREFIGNKWFAFLKEYKIHFTIRIKKNAIINDLPEEKSKSVFDFVEQKKYKKRKKLFYTNICIYGINAHFCAKKEKNEWSYFLTSFDPKNADKRYKLRWKIEVMFSNFKTRGFNLESTHMTDLDKLSFLIAILTVTYCIVIKVAVFLQSKKSIPLKKHGFLAESWVHSALVEISRIIYFNFDKFNILFERF